MPDPMSLAEFTAAAGSLTLTQRKVLVEQAQVLFEQNYAHLPLKIAMHAVDPVQRLRVLRARLERVTEQTMGPEWLFHRELSATFHSVRDLHTNYLLPEPFASRFAYLPFQLERTGAGQHLVTRVFTGFTAPGFEPGAQITHWNGTPIARAVAVNGAQYAGSNPAANLARGLDSLTLRPLVIQLPPDEDWVVVTYISLDGTTRELREPWRVGETPASATDTTKAFALGLDLDSDARARVRKLLYRPDVVALEGGDTSTRLTEPAAAADGDLATFMPGVFRARTVQTAHGTFGHLRIFTFHVPDPFAFRDEFVRLAALLPQNGLIVDVRDNGGGHIWAAEMILQTLTFQAVEPEPVQFIATPLNLRLCRRHSELAAWRDSIDQATETGQVFSAAHPVTPPHATNDIGQTYHGPVVLITDARCYSATDMFAAGFADHGIGTILGVDDNTGAGGANVWTHSLLAQLLREPAPADPESPYEALPNGADMRVSIRRTLRVGPHAGTPLEDLGVRPDQLHALTREDLLNGNADLLDEAGKLLAGQVVRKFVVAVSLAAAASAGTGELTVGLDTTNVGRADFYLDGRPVDSLALHGEPVTTAVPDVEPGQVFRVEGFAGADLVCVRQLIT
ncbi:MAG: S41 family peptidase [Kibdelosporangium sp.]